MKLFSKLNLNQNLITKNLQFLAKMLGRLIDKDKDIDKASVSKFFLEDLEHVVLFEYFIELL